MKEMKNLKYALTTIFKLLNSLTFTYAKWKTLYSIEEAHMEFHIIRSVLITNDKQNFDKSK